MSAALSEQGAARHGARCPVLRSAGAADGWNVRCRRAGRCRKGLAARGACSVSGPAGALAAPGADRGTGSGVGKRAARGESPSLAPRPIPAVSGGFESGWGVAERGAGGNGGPVPLRDVKVKGEGAASPGEPAPALGESPSGVFKVWLRRSAGGSRGDPGWQDAELRRTPGQAPRTLEGVRGVGFCWAGAGLGDIRAGLPPRGSVALPLRPLFYQEFYRKGNS